MANPSWSKAKHAARDVHLDQDAAGRLLEITSNRDPREMTVAMAKGHQTEPGLQTDCPITKQPFTESLVKGCFISYAFSSSDQPMYKQVINLIITTISFTACISPGKFPPTTSPLPSPSKPETVAKATGLSARQWTFNFHNEAHTYYSTSQTILDSDSIGGRDTISITAWFTVAINRSQMPVSISGHIDSVMLKSGLRIGAEGQQISVPINFSGIINSNRLVLNTTTRSSTFAIQTENNPCDSSARSLLGEIRGGIVALPTKLQSSSRWADTISTETCSGNRVPSNLEIIRSYKVIGEKTSGNTPVLLIKRTEHIHLIGDGVQGQHQIKLEGEGTGSSDIALDLATGTPLVIDVYQELRLTFILSGKPKHFSQRVKQQITLIP